MPKSGGAKLHDTITNFTMQDEVISSGEYRLSSVMLNQDHLSTQSALRMDDEEFYNVVFCNTDDSKREQPFFPQQIKAKAYYHV